MASLHSAAASANPTSEFWTNLPDEHGHFGPYGGKFIAETLFKPVDELIEAYDQARRDPEFEREFRWELRHFVG
ncbi:MAG: hypothetical protein N2483_10735, partial [Burkholderiaceae bacterium]|nr:hypothetical protein [Burkholderiaceae bacterium]